MRILFLGILFLFYGCASSTPQANQLLDDFKELPAKAKIDNVPFYLQTEGHCGPATLAMVLNRAGIDAQMEGLAASAFSPESNGTYQLDMISAVRRNQALALPLKNMPDLFQEIANGNPVIVFENLGLEWLPQWHYAVVFGYDLNKEVVHMHSGAEKDKVWDIRKFERSWKLGDYWGLVVLPPGELSKTASKKEHLRAAAALEKLGFLEEAQKSYAAMSKKWENDPLPLMGLGNVAFLKDDFKAAEIFYKKAKKLNPDLPFARRNLALSRQKLAKLRESNR